MSLAMSFLVFSSRISSVSVAGDGASQANDDDEEQGHERADSKQLSSVLVHTRSLLKFLNAHAVSKTTIACTKEMFSSPASL
jgi:hypothetical protein